MSYLPKCPSISPSSASTEMKVFLTFLNQGDLGSCFDKPTQNIGINIGELTMDSLWVP